MPDCESTLKGLSEVSEYLLAKTDIAGAGKGKEVFGFWYRSVEDALALLKEQDKQINDLKAELAKTKDNFSEYVEMMKEKQEPVKPVTQEGFSSVKCGKCNSTIPLYCIYCPFCGMAVKWE